MTTSRQSLLTRVLVPAASPVNTSWQVSTVVILSSIFLHLLNGGDVRPGGLLFRVFAATIAVLPMLAVVRLAQLTRPSGTRAGVVWVLSSYVIGGALRGTLLSYLLDAAQLQEGGAWQYRVPAGALTMSISTALITFGWETYTSHQRIAKTLREESLQLQQALEQLEVESQAEMLRQIGDVSMSLVRDLDAISMRPAGTQVLEIQRLIDERVRPMSRDTAVTVTQWSPKSIPTAVPRMTEVWQHTNPLDHLPSPWIAGTIALVPIPLATYVAGLPAALRASGSSLLALIVIIQVSYPVLRARLRNVPPPRRDVLLTVGLCLLGAAAGAAADFFLHPVWPGAAFMESGILSVPLYGWITILAGMFWQASRDHEVQLLNVRSELEWAIARIGLLSWFHRGVISRLLHGPIQNAMHATVIRLRDQEPGLVVDGIIAELRHRIADVEPMTQESPVASPAVTLHEIRTLWAGIAQVQYDVAPDVEQALAADAPAAAIVSDMCHEVCSNAIRHGSASDIHITITLADYVLSLTVVDDGSPHAVRTQAGIGTKFLQTCSIAWSSERNGDRNRLQVAIPCEGTAVVDHSASQSATA